jgi:RNA polymerase sigma-70 factor (ECF subfamily)
MVVEIALIAALQRRDEQALAQVFEQYADKIYRLALSTLRDEQQADGVVQDTFLKLIEHIDRFEARASIGTWLYRVAYHECLGRLRRAKNVPDSLDDGLIETTMPTHFVDWQTLPETLLSHQETQSEIHKAIATLPETLRSVVTLRDIDELSTRETALILGISEAAVKVRLHRARLLLREHLASYFEEYLRP